MTATDFATQARTLEHNTGHHRRTIVCNPVEAEDIEEAIEKLMTTPKAEGKIRPTVFPSQETPEGCAWITCHDCMESRLP